MVSPAQSEVSTADLINLTVFCYLNNSRPHSPFCFVFVQIWVNSPHSASGYYTIYGEESLQADHFNTRLSFGEPHTLWARTGYLGFIKRTELLDASGGDKVDLMLCLSAYSVFSDFVLGPFSY